MLENKPIKILLVEDDDDLRESLVDCLELRDFVVCAVPNALTFYQKLSSNNFDIALIDIGLPDQSGLDIVIHLKKTSSIGIVVLTAMGSPEIRLKGYKYGADLYLVKPIYCQELAAALLNLAARLHKNKTAGEVSAKQQDTELSWTLNIAQSSLMISSGALIELTQRETTFLQILIRHCGNTIDRVDISQHLNMPITGKNDRRMDTMTRRLRKKVKNESGKDLPIQTIYGEGYIFTGHAIIK